MTASNQPLHRKPARHLAIATWVPARNALARFWRDQRGASISTVLLIAILVIAIFAFGGIVAGQINTAGQSVGGVDFTGNNPN